MRNEDIFSNIRISDEMKQDIYENCVNKKRTTDFRFRHSGAILAALLVFTVGLTGIGASAAVLSFINRMENMPKEEATAYKQEVKDDDFISTDEGFSRELTKSEIKRVLKLERDYYDRNIFPEKAMAHYDKKSELAPGEFAYVKEDNMVYLPDTMTDEQLLEYIDHDAKKRYINIEELKKEGVEPGRGMALESTRIAEGSTESKAVEVAKSAIKEEYGVTVGDNWVVLIDYFDEFKNDEDASRNIPALYNLFIYPRGTGFATTYQVRIKADDLSLMDITKS